MAKNGDSLVRGCAQFLLVRMIGEAVREEDGVYLAMLQPCLKLSEVSVCRRDDVSLAAEEREIVDLGACKIHRKSRRGHALVQGLRVQVCTAGPEDPPRLGSWELTREPWVHDEMEGRLIFCALE